jgi:hypothetical protein
MHKTHTIIFGAELRPEMMLERSCNLKECSPDGTSKTHDHLIHLQRVAFGANEINFSYLQDDDKFNEYPGDSSLTATWKLILGDDQR